MHFPSQSGAHARVPLANRVGPNPHAPVRHGREDPSIRLKVHAGRRGQLHAAGVVSRQQCQRLRIEGDPPLLMSLGVLLPCVGALLGDTRADLQYTGREIDAIPAQRAQLPAPRSGHHGKPHEHAPVRVLPGLNDDASRLVPARRLRIRLRDGGLRGLRGWVHRKPAPADSAAQRRAEVRVNQPDCRRRQWPTGVPGLASATASVSAPPELGVQRLQHLSIEPAHRHDAQHRPHVPVQPADHAVAGGRLHLRNLKPPIEQLVHRGLRTRVATLVNLVQEARPNALGIAGRRRSGGHRLDQVMPLLRHRIDAGVDPHSKRSTGQLLDLTTAPTATPRRARHGHTVAIRSTYGSTQASREAWPRGVLPSQKREPPWGVEPQTYALRVRCSAI